MGRCALFLQIRHFVPSQVFWNQYQAQPKMAEKAQLLELFLNFGLGS